MLPITDRLARDLKARPSQITAAVELFDAGNTLPFIARYRKEVTGGLDDAQLAHLSDQLAQWRLLDERRQTILAEIENQGKLTPALRDQIAAAETRTALEDLYQPYRPKRRTRAGAAREKGLQPLAELIVRQPPSYDTLEQLVQPFLNPETVPTVEDALAGARDIVAEIISDNTEIRRQVREKALRWGGLIADKIPEAEDERKVFETYYAFGQRLDRIRPHQVLALNRGEKEKVLRVRLDLPERDWRDVIEYYFRADRRSPLAPHLAQAIDDAAARLLLPAIERDVRRGLNETAETHALSVFTTNLRALLTQPPLVGHSVLGIDPGLRTGCKLAVVDPTGKMLATATIYPFPPRRQREQSLATIDAMVISFGVDVIAIGNGTASRETEQLVAEYVRQKPGVQYLIVNEAGASVYSASALARAELPDLDVTLRGAVSIARRAQDPLAELVKIDPRSIGVGLYQHDVNQERLSRGLHHTVESVVNQVGVDLNTASPALLGYAAGIGPKLAADIVAYRNEHGAFKSRAALTDVPGLGPKSFEQAAGFLRVRDGDEPLDASAIHPESYGLARAVLERAGLTLAVPPAERAPALARWQDPAALKELAAELNAGQPTLADILEQLVRPGRDPRADLPAPMLRSDVLSLDDLQPGQRLKGTVRNVVDFGAFIDVGVKQDGLLHRTRLPRGLVLSPGDVVEVEISSVDKERNRISLGWPGKEKPRRGRGPGKPGQRPAKGGQPAPAEAPAAGAPEAAEQDNTELVSESESEPTLVSESEPTLVSESEPALVSESESEPALVSESESRMEVAMSVPASEAPESDGSASPDDAPAAPEKPLAPPQPADPGAPSEAPEEEGSAQAMADKAKTAAVLGEDPTADDDDAPGSASESPEEEGSAES
jgi:protein Tex